MKNERFFITGENTAETFGEICRALGECYAVYWDDRGGIGFKRISE